MIKKNVYKNTQKGVLASAHWALTKQLGFLVEIFFKKGVLASAYLCFQN